MRQIVYNSMTEFIAELDGYVYAICNGNGEYICDVLQDEYIELFDSGKLIDDWDGIDFKCFSDYVFKETLDEEWIEKFKEQYGVDIIIK